MYRSRYPRNSGLARSFSLGCMISPEPAISRNNSTIRPDICEKNMFMPELEPRNINPPGVIAAVCSIPSIACRHTSV